MDASEAAETFVPAQLTRARELRSMTKTKLAEQVDLSPSTISHYESARTSPSTKSLTAIAMALRFPLQWFTREPKVDPIKISDGFFRSMSSASQYHRRKVLQDGRLVSELLQYLQERGIRFPEDEISPAKKSVRSDDSIEAYATDVRKKWELSLGPIKDPISLLESKGARVVVVGKKYDSVGAFSCWHEHQPFVFLVNKAPSRVHFDCFHEIGHLLLHEDVEPGNPNIEDQANRFAGAFLLPKQSFGQECPERWNESAFLALKRRWCVSIQAAVYRAHQIGKLSTSSYRYAFRQINANGWKKAEPAEWELENPQLLQKAFEALEVNKPVEYIAEALCLSRPHAKHLYTMATNPASSNSVKAEEAGNKEHTDDNRVTHFTDESDISVDGTK